MQTAKSQEHCWLPWTFYQQRRPTSRLGTVFRKPQGPQEEKSCIDSG